MMYKLGLKLWSTNTDDYLREAQKLFDKKIYDYIELYIVPDTTDRIEKWKALTIPFLLHAPHFAHNVNLAVKEKFKYNQKIYEQVEEYRTALNAKYTVVHGGIDGDIDETVRQLKIIQPKNMLIENKPYRAPFGKRNLCRGYNKEEIKKVMDEIGCGFCLDIGHAICTANSLNINPYEFLKDFNELNPTMYHLSDGDITSDTDKHLHIKDGSYNFNRIFDIIDENKLISIETKKDSQTNLNDFEKDVNQIREVIND